VADSVITESDLERQFEQNKAFFGMNIPSKKRVLQDLIRKELGVQEARARGLYKKRAVKDRIDDVLFQAFINDALSETFNKIIVQDNEAANYYKKNPEIRTSHIFVPLKLDASAKESETAKEKILDIYNRHIKGKTNIDFVALAQKYSTGSSAPLGGDIDYQTVDKLDPAYYQAAIKLSGPGAISGVVKTQLGYHIIKLTALKGWDAVDQSKIKRLVFERKKRDAYENYMDKLKKKYKVSINF